MTKIGSKIAKHTYRPLSAIAKDIRADWKTPYFGAVPYLDAMHQMKDIREMYGSDPGREVVAYFLSNARGWKGETARRIKAELNAMMVGKPAVKEIVAPVDNTPEPSPPDPVYVLPTVGACFRNGWLVLAVKQAKEPHLAVVVAFNASSYDPFVVWSYNMAPGCVGANHGDYCRTIKELYLAFDRKCERYGCTEVV